MNLKGKGKRKMALIEKTMRTDPNGKLYFTDYPLKSEFYEKLNSIYRQLELLDKINKKKNWIRRRKR